MVEDLQTETMSAQAIDSIPLIAVDLDGTLVNTDVMWESLLLAIRRDPLAVLKVPSWLLRGRAGFKREIARRVTLEPAKLPYRRDVLDLVKAHKDRACRVVLATASDRMWAEAIAKHLGLFDDVIASDGTSNVKGAHKLKAIQEYCQDHQISSFGYVGDSSADLPIWESADAVYAVCPSPAVLKRIQLTGKAPHVIGSRVSRATAVLRALRPQQWLKNVLLFLPLLLAHELGDLFKLQQVVFAFVAFSACASSVYVLNDLFDLEADRRHPKKRKRPFASGDLPIIAGVPICCSAALFGFLLAAFTLPLSFVALLGLYMVVTSLYSFWLKRKVLIDVFTLAGLYTVRILAGGEAANVAVSEWLMVFAMFMFTSLAFAKRYAELDRLSAENAEEAAGRGYLVSDRALVESMGSTAGYISVLVFALYVNGKTAQTLYGNIWALWLIGPLLLYWISRVWLLARRGLLHEDPVVFAVSDRTSLLVGAIAVVLLVVATMNWTFSA